MAQMLLVENGPGFRTASLHALEVIQEEDSIPHELARIRDQEDEQASESLHSFNFTGINHKSFDNRRSVIHRSLDLVRSLWYRKVAAQSGSSLPPSRPPMGGKEEALGDNRLNISINTADIPGLQNQAAVHALQSPTRFSPHTKATITTDADFTVLTVNEVASLALGMSTVDIVGKNALSLLNPPYRMKFEKLLTARGTKKTSQRDAVLVCGSVVRMQRGDKSTYPASLWLKEKFFGDEHKVYIWVIEEIKEITVSIVITQQGRIVDASVAFSELYGYERSEIPTLSVVDIIPSLASAAESDHQSAGPLDLGQISRLKFFGSRTKYGTTFPIIAKLHGLEHVSHAAILAAGSDGSELEIISMSNIAGVITVLNTGMIQSCNPVFTKYLFGSSAKELVGKTAITDLIPQFWTLVESVGGVDGSPKMVSASACRRIAAVSPLSASPMTPAASNLDASSAMMSSAPSLASPSLSKRSSTGSIMMTTGIVAMHRDGTPFNVDVHIRTLHVNKDAVFALWVSFDRDASRPSIPRALGEAEVEEDKEDVGLAGDLVQTALPAVPPAVDVADAAKRSKDESRHGMEGPGLETIPESRKPQFSSQGSRSDEVQSSDTLAQDSISPPSDTPIYNPTRTVDDYETIESLGEGAYGYVRLARLRNNPAARPVVIKYIVRNRILLDCWTRDAALGGLIPLEVHILHRLRTASRHSHPRIVKMLEFFSDETYFYVVMERHGVGMDLFDAIEMDQGMGEEKAKRIFGQVVDAVAYLHKEGIVHRDIKDENIILDEHHNAQLVDFGSSAYVKPAGKKFDTFCGTLDYAAPEVLLGHKYEGKPQDIWALGILLYTLLYKENPFYNIDEIIAGELRIPHVISEDSLELIKWMLARDVQARPTIEQVASHPWLKMRPQSAKTV
ncbi:hypothetical protein HK104_000642 [Borealophlyctis nickersoniae]|nr:hypothetical protein HK104_000642 [Borealophlyctis nickersoniae]